MDTQINTTFVFMPTNKKTQGEKLTSIEDQNTES